MLIRVTEGELKRMIAESVQRLMEFDESYFGGFDEGGDEPKRQPEDRDGDGDTSNTDMERKRNVVLDMFSNDDE